MSCSTDYDIDNIIVPMGMGPTAIEAVKVKEVFTPTWRVSTDDGPFALDGHASSSSSVLNSPMVRFFFPLVVFFLFLFFFLFLLLVV